MGLTKTYVARKAADATAGKLPSVAAPRRLLQRAPAPAAHKPPPPKTQPVSQVRQNLSAETVAAVIVAPGQSPSRGRLHVVGPGAACDPGQGMSVAGFIHADGSAVKFLADGGGVYLSSAQAAGEFHEQVAAATRLLQGAHPAAHSQPLHRQAETGAAVSSTAAVDHALQSSAGRPLSARSRTTLESSYGTDLGTVRVHTDAAADQAARSVQAQAFTTGQDVFFRAGHYQPDSTAGGRLLAHEVAHTIQQGSQTAAVSRTPQNVDWQISEPSDVFEKDAERAADAAVHGRPASIRSLSDSGATPLARRADTTAVNPPAATPVPAHGPGKVASGSSPAPATVAPLPAAKKDTAPPPAKPSAKPAGDSPRPGGPKGGRQGPPAQARADQPAGAAPGGKMEAHPGVGLPSPGKAGPGKAIPGKTGAGKAGPGHPGAGKGEAGAPQADEKGKGKAAGGKPGAPLKGAAKETEAHGPAPEGGGHSGLQSVVAGVGAAGHSQKQHDPAEQKAAETEKSADVTPDQAQGHGKGEQVQAMARQEKKPFDREKFKAALREKIRALQAEDAKNIKEGDQAQGLNDAVKSGVAQEKQSAAGNIAQAAKQDPPAGEPKPGEKLPAPEPGAPPAVDGSQAVPAPVPPDRTSMEGEAQAVDNQMAAAKVTPEQLEKANEPTFQAAANAHATAKSEAEVLPDKARAAEGQILAKAGTDVATVTAGGLAGMHGKRTDNLAAGSDKQADGKAKFEATRKKVTDELTKIYDDTKKAVDDRLTLLDKEVADTFDDGASSAKTKFYIYLGARLLVYYAGGGWLVDAFTGGNSKEKIFEDGRNEFMADMDKVIDQVADVVERGLNEVVGIIAAGKARLDEALQRLGPEEQAVGRDVAAGIQGKFADLEKSVEEKQTQIINSVAEKFVAAQKDVDSTINTLRDPVGAAINYAKDAIAGVIKTIMELKALLLGVLAKAGDAIELIIADPIGFLGNLVAGIKQGVLNFVGNIATHLKNGFFEWLFGTLAAAGIQMPKAFDLKGVLGLVLQILGLTYANFRSRAVKIVGEKVVKTIETASEIFIKLVTEGPAALWEWIKEQASNLLSSLIDGIKSFLIEKVIMAGVTWLIGLLNPASAFVKACKAIYDVVMFFIERGQQILTLVNAVLDSVTAIARGSIGVAAKFVENALAKAIPVAIGFLAGLLGLGGLSDRIKALIEKIQAPVNAAIDWVINKAVALVKAVGKLLGFGKEKQDPDPDHQMKVTSGLAALDQESAKYRHDGKISEHDASVAAATVKGQHPVFKQIQVVGEHGHWKYRYVASPEAEVEAGEQTDDDASKVLYVTVSDIKPPGGSRIGALPPASPQVLGAKPDDKLAPKVFEQEVGASVAATQGLPAPIPGAKDRWPGMTGASGLPASPTLLAEPKTNLGGKARADDIFKRPDFVVLSPSGAPQIEVFEVTLDSEFRIPEGGQEATPGAPSHKRVQVAATIFAIGQRYPGVPIIYNIRATKPPSDAAKSHLDRELRNARAGGGDVQIIWRTG